MTAARRWLACALAMLALGAAGCGSSSSDRFRLRTPPPKVAPSAQAGKGDAAKRRALNRKEPVTEAERRVIRGWAATLRHGHVIRAARYFTLPAVLSNGFAPVKATKRVQIEEFNRGLTCGAQVIGFQRQVHHYVLATFRLVTRTGEGARRCPGGATARTAFLIRRGRIAQWVRVPDSPSSPGSGATANAS